MTRPLSRIAYVTSNSHKHEEVDIFRAEATFDDGQRIADFFTIDVRSVSIVERLEIDIELMVRHEAVLAYGVLKVPCVVEHAGLIFDGYEDVLYPGGLTKPMWNALGANFSKDTRSAQKGATAKAVVAYCDGMTVRTFAGTTHGYLASSPSGSRSFYWDTIFVPDDQKRPGAALTYAQIVETPSLGLRYKVIELSQSTKAMLSCLQFIRDTLPNRLWAY